MDRIDEWRTFLTVASQRSFVAAARTLGRSPQAVTRAIASLETRMGVRLLHRTTRAVSLTADGADALERGRRVIDELEQLEQRPDPRAKLSGTVTVTAPVLFGQMRVLPVVSELLAKHPDLDVRMLLVDRVVSLADEGVDVAVRIGPLADSALHARRVGEVRAVVVASPKYLERAGVPKEPRELADRERHACIAFTGTTPVPERWAFGSRPIKVRPRLVVTSGPAALEAALAGLGVVRLLSYQVEKLVDAGRLRVVLAEHEAEPLPVHLVYPAGLQTRSAAAFMALAEERLRA